MTIDCVDLAARLIRCPSVTPKEGGALDLLQTELETLGFTCTRLPFEESGTERVDNLYARIGTKPPHICFAGHTDVVPIGDRNSWEFDPFAAVVKDGKLWGRGACDMKSAIAAFVCAIERHLNIAPLQGSISLLITGDEEGIAINGTVKMLKWLEENDELINDCIVGEPTSLKTLGDMIKIGRRGSLNGVITVTGRQGHVAYPHLAKNPLPILVECVDRLIKTHLDNGTEDFQPSHLEITSIDTNNLTTNIIPETAQARFNIRYNTEWTLATLTQKLHETIGDSPHISLELNHSGDAFLNTTSEFTNVIVDSIQNVTGVTPELSTSGGTSDARFIKNYSSVLEFGLINATIHKVNEHVETKDIETLTDIYQQILKNYFS